MVLLSAASTKQALEYCLSFSNFGFDSDSIIQKPPRILQAHLETAGMYYVVENPTSSCIFDSPSLKKALSDTGARRVTVHLHGYGGASSKPLWLAGTAPWLWRLEVDSRTRCRLSKKRGLLPDSTTVRRDQDTGAVYGIPARLQSSQEYPLSFSKFVAETHKAFLDQQNLL